MNPLNDSAQVSVSQPNDRFPKQSAGAGAASAQDAALRDISIAVPAFMANAAEIFQSHRARLFGLAYRMLGSRFEAEDLLQEAYIRWHQSATQHIQSPVAFLVTLTSRLCLDRLRQLKQEREHYVGPWLPQPLVEEESPSPEEELELTDEISIAFLAVLERLGPEERVAFLLHDVFDYDYPEVAGMVGKSEPTCRQMIHRARARVRESRSRFPVTAETRERVLGKFLAAVKTGDRQAVMALLAEDVEYMADGGGVVVAALKVLRGPERVGWLYHCVARRFVGVQYRLARVNGELGAIAIMDGRVFSVMAFQIEGDHISRVYNIRNPDKLKGVSLPASSAGRMRCHKP